MKENNKTYWKSFEELVKDPSYVQTLEHEFTQGSSEASSDFHLNRRTFLKLLGASVALATTSCRRPVHKIFPYVKQPENVKPGMAQYYASTFSFNNHSTGILVKTREGRPIKIEGNPDHPISQGSAGAFAQASILELYDPNRKRNPTIDEKIVSWEEWDLAALKTLKQAKNIRILTESTTSPTLRITIEKCAAHLNAKWYEYEPISQETKRNAFRNAFGSPKIPKLHLDNAKVIVSINSDFLGSYDGQSLMRDWANGRKIRSIKDTMNRLYVIESFFSLTGSNSDHRLPLKLSELLPFLLSLARILVFDYQLSQDLKARTLLQSIKVEKNKDFLKALAEDLVKNRGKAILLVGGQESLELQMIGLFINSLVGTFSSPIIDNHISLVTFDNGYESIKPLLTEINAGKVDCLITVGGNPAYHFSSFKAALKNIPSTIRLSLYHDETAEVSKYTAPLSHFLESWGDSYAQDGIVSLIQPTIQPLYKSRTAGEVFLMWMTTRHPDLTTLWLNEIKDHWKKYIYSRRNSMTSFESFWEGALHDGVVLEKTHGTNPFSFNTAALEKIRIKKQNSEALELQLHPSYTTFDGRFANSGWLQELPDPVTKVTWDNVASMNPKTASKYGLKEGDVIEISLNTSSVTLPVLFQPGLAEDMITTSIGYGRTVAGDVGNQVGSNAYILGERFQYTQVQLKKLYKHHKLAITQGHHNMEGRPIIREATLTEYKKDPELTAGHPERSEGSHALLSLYPNHEYKGHKWGMAIDLNSCVGCSGCVIACNAENNIPVIGKAQVVKGREMQWLRMDRYYEGSQENPRVLHQPMLCQHCENAPCESVCPVAATTHSSEGLNEMTYNRCVGTRYCQNNCPYKVRRFNFLNYNVDIETPQDLGKNPDVTVRMRGIMEKCTFCVHRINEEKINGKMLGIERLADGQVKTACQEACSSGAIVFGDLNDPSSAVSKLSKLSHGYHVLEDLNTKPSITYLAKIRNPNPKLTEGSHA